MRDNVEVTRDCPSSKSVERWQHRLTPLWRHISGGCHLDRKVDDLIRAAGFEILELRNEYARGPQLMTYMYEGRARPAVSVLRDDLIKGARNSASRCSDHEVPRGC